MTPPVLLAAALAQTTPTPKLPPANPVPYTDVDAANVLLPVNALLSAIAAGDSAALLAQVRPDGSATAALERPDGTRAVRRMSWPDFAAQIKPGPERYAERLLDPAVETDGDIAMVWSPYVFTINGRVDHCGADHFDLVRENNRWRVLNVTWSQRNTGCEG